MADHLPPLAASDDRGRSGELPRPAAAQPLPDGVRPGGAGPTPARRALTGVGVAAAVTVGLLFLWAARDVLLLAFAGVLLAIFFRRLGTWVSGHTPLSPKWGLVVVVLGLFGSLVAAFALRGPAIAEEIRTLQEQLPQAAESLKGRLAAYDWGRRAIEEVPSARALLPDSPDAISRATGVVSSTVSALGSFAIIVFLGIVLAATPGVYANGLLALLPARAVGRGREVIARLYDTLWWWLVGRVLSMTFIGVVTGVGLWLLGVPLAFPLGLLAALLSFIPNLGPILSAVPAVLLALAQTPRIALWVVLLYTGVQIVESFVLDPIIDRKTVYLPPALTVVAQLVLAVFAGILGVALATPLTAALVVLVTMLYVQGVLARHDVDLPAR